ncbi:hypothetical protein HPP92_011671 [Vanilla planifolia]|uniref:Uncharacterized protein n=1 Tax=Vanilla planifolia TaxID=51239 RepID=A0A835RC12_VANPL|nr:hypothetical protein HPP92_011671 [Vanilla planifolia]
MATAGLTSQTEKLHSRLRSKESSASAPSFRIYYGMAAGSVPFRWESRPGTPKDSTTTSATSADIFRPLTPPPSYYATSPKTQKPPAGKSPKNGLIHAILPKIANRKPALPPPTPPSPSPSSSSSSSFSWSSKWEEENDREETSSPTSTLCFGGGRGKRNAQRSIGRHGTPA